MRGPDAAETQPGRTILTTLRALRSAPEPMAWLAVVVVTAAWVARNGTLPARLVPIHGIAVTALVFACLYAARIHRGRRRRCPAPVHATGARRRADPGGEPGEPRRLRRRALVDPYDLAWRYTADPMPNMRTLLNTATGGYGIVPDRFGGSASTEFEALTSMTRAFLPDGSVPYRQYLRRPIPSLPETLHGLGYRTTAVQADPKYYYDRERAYGLLGFDRVVWLNETPEVERALRGHWVSDTAVVDAVIRASRDASPFFVFAFPTSTPSPYTFGTYSRSDLDLVDRPADDVAGEVTEYVNAVRVADRAIGALIQHFSQRPEPTIVAIFGDHLPPLSARALEAFWVRLSRAPAAEHDRMTRRVPLVVWANFPLDREPVELSISALPSYLLERMGIARSGFFAVSDAVRRLVPVLASQAAIGGHRPAAPAALSGEARAVLDDYKLLQYHLLLGRQ